MSEPGVRIVTSAVAPRHRGQATHCVRGHRLCASHVDASGWRRCRECDRQRARLDARVRRARTLSMMHSQTCAQCLLGHECAIGAAFSARLVAREAEYRAWCLMRVEASDDEPRLASGFLARRRDGSGRVA